jgi:HAD superfamily hydrolase (TIGR01549 family)
MQHYDAYLFDWDGTLADSHGMWLRIMHSQLERYGLHLTDQEIVRQLFGRYEEGIKDLGLLESDYEYLEQEILDFGRQQLPLTDFYAEADEVLKVLAAKDKKLAVITASYREVIDAAITHHAYADLLAITVAGDEVRAQKPDPEGIKAALTALGVPASRALMIGDSKKDIMAGRNAGTDTLLFYPPAHETQHDIVELRECGPTYIIHSWREFLDTLQ